MNWRTRVHLIWHIFFRCLYKYMEQNSIDDVRMDKVWKKQEKRESGKVHGKNSLKTGQSDGEVVVVRRASRGRRELEEVTVMMMAERAQWFKPCLLYNLVVLKPSLAGIDRECTRTCELWWVGVHWVPATFAFLLVFYGSNIFSPRACYYFAFLHLVVVIIIIINSLSLCSWPNPTLVSLIN